MCQVENGPGIRSYKCGTEKWTAAEDSIFCIGYPVAVVTRNSEFYSEANSEWAVLVKGRALLVT